MYYRPIIKESKMCLEKPGLPFATFLNFIENQIFAYAKAMKNSRHFHHLIKCSSYSEDQNLEKIIAQISMNTEYSVSESWTDRIITRLDISIIELRRGS